MKLLLHRELTWREECFVHALTGGDYDITPRVTHDEISQYEMHIPSDALNSRDTTLLLLALSECVTRGE